MPSGRESRDELTRVTRRETANWRETGPLGLVGHESRMKSTRRLLFWAQLMNTLSF